MNKKITIIGINYYPEDSAIGLYTTQKAEYLVKQGYDVTVVTGFPYYPQWEISNDYKKRSYLLKETINGVKVLRSKQYVPKNPTFVKRILHLMSFTIGNFINLFKIHSPDIVIAIIPFTTSALLGWFLKLRYKSKLWVHIQDFEFNAAIDSGLLSDNKRQIINILLWIEKKVLKKSDIVSTISHGMIARLKQKSVVNTYLLTNWIDITLFSKTQNTPHKYLQSSKFKILYSGNIGAKQDWVFFINFLEKLESISGVEVILVGDGAEKEKLLSQICKYNFVSHYGLVPFQDLPSLLNSADLHILFQKTDVIDTVMPSKLLGMMASQKPSIVTGNLHSEVAKVYKESKAGYYFDGTSLNDIINTIKDLKENIQLRKRLGNNAKNYVLKNYSQEKVLSDFANQLEDI